jgi:hypothetical protein
MATTLPVQIEFSLPDGWLAAPPDEVGAPTAAFVALSPEPGDGFRANITIAGHEHNGTKSLSAMAEESVQRLSQGGPVRVGQRAPVGGWEAPGLTQTLHLSTTLQGHPIELTQAQVYLDMADVTDPSKRAVIELALTSRTSQFDGVIDEFREFVASVAPTSP